MFSPNKKIYLMVASQPAGLQGKEWLSAVPELGIIANVQPIFVFKKPSADITSDVWVRLAKEIYQNFDKASGFVVMHGIDNLLYTSSVISFLLQNLTKPVIFTGSHGLPDMKKQEARANLINACQAATCELNEVALMFGNRLLRANQASCGSEPESFNVFSTPPSAILGRIDFSIRIFEKAITNNKGKVKFFSSMNDRIEIISANPLLNFKDLAARLAGKDGVVVDLSRYHDLPQDLLFLFEKIALDVPVLIWSRQIDNQAFLPKNFLLVNNMTWEAAVTKFMWVLGQSKNIKQIHGMMAKNFSGEIIG
jgi:L-asparaginase